MLLAGDAAHAFSPITGAGCNQGIIDVVVLSNKLRGLLDMAATQNTTTTNLPTVKQLNDTFLAYQEERKGPVGRECQVAMSMTNTASWVGIVRRLADQYLMSLGWLQNYIMKYAMADIAKTPSFDFLPADNHVVGKMPWQANL
ncbi:hypothetical protein NQ176_g10167 [Zarea fungicola]|uniref:Uncharacterized protein n=1 Tax=Zarea fungicola TaxID=93591 RepID=A0ACC1MHS3_9HYPO|nr:hypothetical protein NQ176_g10167 [Lecanicillium fungicola]